MSACETKQIFYYLLSKWNQIILTFQWYSSIQMWLDEWVNVVMNFWMDGQVKPGSEDCWTQR